MLPSLCSKELLIPFLMRLPNGRCTRWWRHVDSPCEQYKPEARKCSKMGTILCLPAQAMFGFLSIIPIHKHTIVHLLAHRLMGNLPIHLLPISNSNNSRKCHPQQSSCQEN